MKLYFIRSNDERVLVNDTVEEKYVTKYIKDFVKEKNPKFDIYYFRSWKTKEGVMYDVGSHAEFFLLSKE